MGRFQYDSRSYKTSAQWKKDLFDKKNLPFIYEWKACRDLDQN